MLGLVIDATGGHYFFRKIGNDLRQINLDITWVYRDPEMVRYGELNDYALVVLVVSQGDSLERRVEKLRAFATFVFVVAENESPAAWELAKEQVVPVFLDDPLAKAPYLPLDLLGEKVRLAIST